MDSGLKKSTIKYIFLVFNSIWFVSGIALVIIGTLLKINYKLIIGDGMDMVYKLMPNSTVMIFIIVGSIIIFVSLFGNCGTAMNDSCLLYSYSVITVLLLIIQCIAIVLAFNFSHRLEQNAEKKIRKDIEDYNWNQTLNQMSDIDSLQNKLECCGANNFSDWNLNQHFKHNQYPFSCCSQHNYSVNCTIRTVGCVHAIDARINHKVLTLVGVSVIVNCVQMIITLMACLLAHEIRNYESI